MEHFLLNIALVSPFFLTLLIFTVAIVFAPGVKNEIAPAAENDHEEMDHARSSSREMVAVLAPGLRSERDDSGSITGGNQAPDSAMPGGPATGRSAMSAQGNDSGKAAL